MIVFSKKLCMLLIQNIQVFRLETGNVFQPTGQIPKSLVFGGSKHFELVLYQIQYPDRANL